MGKAGSGSVNVGWRWERTKRPRGGAACEASSPFLPIAHGTVLQLLEDNVNRFGEVVHVRIGLHVGVVFIARPAK